MKKKWIYSLSSEFPAVWQNWPSSQRLNNSFVFVNRPEKGANALVVPTFESLPLCLLTFIDSELNKITCGIVVH